MWFSVVRARFYYKHGVWLIKVSLAACYTINIPAIVSHTHCFSSAFLNPFSVLINFYCQSKLNSFAPIQSNPFSLKEGNGYIIFGEKAVEHLIMKMTLARILKSIRMYGMAYGTSLSLMPLKKFRLRRLNVINEFKYIYAS